MSTFPQCYPIKTLLRLGILSLALACGTASAWGLKTHLWIAEKIIVELKQAERGEPCSLELGLNRRYKLRRDVCDAIREKPEYFRAGALGPDAFPDILAGQLTVHPGIEERWGTDYFLRHLIAKAQQPGEIAFAFGVQVHAAGDVFAHTYVNNYAGDVFNVLDESEVELRHFVLEKYIEFATPGLGYVPSTVEIKVPARFVAEQLIHDCGVRAAYGRYGKLAHLRMFARQTNRARLWLASVNHDSAEVARLKLCLDQDASLMPAAEPALAEHWASLAGFKSTPGLLDGLLPATAGLALSEDELVLREADRIEQEGLLHAPVPLGNKSYALVRKRDWQKKVLEDMVRGMEEATAAYVEASLSVTVDILNDKPGAFSAYVNWQSCWSGSYVGVPYRPQKWLCRTRQRFDAGWQAFVANLPLADVYNRLRALFQKELRKSARHYGDKVAAHLRGKSDSQLIALMLEPRLVDRARLNDTFVRPVNARGKRLLAFPDMAGIIDADIALEGGVARPDRFEALRAAATLAKLSVLDINEVNAMYIELVGPGSRSIFADGAPLYPASTERVSMLADAVRSIDGNHQWQKYGVPYPRCAASAGAPGDPGDACFRPGGTMAESRDAENWRYGYAMQDAAPPRGMRLFIDPQARERLFLAMFSKPVTGGIGDLLNRDPVNNPFMSCKTYPFPITTGFDGKACSSDKRCRSELEVGVAPLLVNSNGCAE